MFTTFLLFSFVAGASTSRLQVGSSAPVLLLVEEFGLAQGGVVKVNASLKSGSAPTSPASDVLIILADKTQSLGWYQPWIHQDQSGNLYEKLCQGPAAARFQLRFSNSTPEVEVSAMTSYADQYSLYLLVCSMQHPVDIDVSSVWLNPDKSGALIQHLPVQFAPLPAIYSVVAIGWVGLLLGWLGFLRAVSGEITAVHHWFTAVAILKLVESVLRAAAWARLARSGEVGSLSFVTSLSVTLAEVLTVHATRCSKHGC
jgi:hypothetical protein